MAVNGPPPTRRIAQRTHDGGATEIRWHPRCRVAHHRGSLCAARYVGSVTARTAVPDGKTYEALIFDWDGTLVDSRDVCFDALARAMGDAGSSSTRIGTGRARRLPRRTC